MSTAASIALSVVGLIITLPAEAAQVKGRFIECYAGRVRAPHLNPNLRSCRELDEEYYGKGNLPRPDSEYDICASCNEGKVTNKANDPNKGVMREKRPSK
ncbi:MAG: hypothetical protein FD149_2156 [Rhodospirillaceae bacterium]|nr:MAG: hypothetical protein FD149_2156 [Rhodospirillaceae bacterium]